MQVDSAGTDLLTKEVQQIFISVSKAEDAITFDSFFRLHPFHQPLHPNQGRIGGVESRDIAGGAASGFTLGPVLRLRLTVEEAEE